MIIQNSQNNINWGHLQANPSNMMEENNESCYIKED